MTLKDFIKTHKEEIGSILSTYGSTYRNYDERRLIVLNDEGLYNLARRRGVRI